MGPYTNNLCTVHCTVYRQGCHHCRGNWAYKGPYTNNLCTDRGVTTVGVIGAYKRKYIIIYVQTGASPL